MDLVKRVVNSFYPLEERAKLRDALDHLAPKFGLSDAPLPRVTRDKHGSGYTPGKRHTVSIGPETDEKTYGEEAGHYLHILANPAFARISHLPALDYLIASNWVECLGRYAGVLHARHRGKESPTGKDWLLAKKRLLKEHLPAAQSFYGRLWYQEQLRGMLNHAVGYRASDELLARDPSGDSLAELARIPPSGIRTYAEKEFRSWPRYWDILEKRFGDVAQKLF